MTLFWTTCAIVFLLPVVTRGKAFVWSNVLLGAAIAIVWAQHIYVTSKPGYTGSVGSSVGEMLMIGLTALWVLGLSVRYIVWLIQLKREEIREKRYEKGSRAPQWRP